MMTTTTKIFGAVAGALMLSVIAFACSSSSGGTSTDVDSGGDDTGAADDGGTGDDGGGPAATRVPCVLHSNPNGSCSAATEYCLTTTTVLDGAVYPTTASCYLLPAGCDACNCIDAGGDFGGASLGDNCKSDGAGKVVVTCTDQNGAIAATCTKTQ